MSEGERDPHDWEVVAEVAELYEAELMALRLREAGIDTRVVDQSFRQEPVPIARSLAIVRVYVPAAREEEARRLLSDVEPLEGGEGDQK